MQGWLALARAVFVTLIAAIAVAGCGGGGGDGEAAAPAPEQTFEGNWTLSLRMEGETTPGVAVPASAVPSAEKAAALTTNAVAQLFASNAFAGYTVTINGTTVKVTGADTDYTLVINSIGTSKYQGCGTCGVGSQVSFDVAMNFTESGTFDGEAFPSVTDTFVVTLIYTRAS